MFHVKHNLLKKYLLITILLTLVSGTIYSINLLLSLKTTNDTNRHHYNVFQSISYYILEPLFQKSLYSYFNQLNYKTYLNDRLFYDQNLYIHDILSGNGKSISCGQKIIAEITENYEAKPTSKTQEFIIGLHNNRTINNGIPGMKDGGIRVVKDLEKNEMFQIKIIDVLDQGTFAVSENLRIFSHEKNFEKAYMCGDKVHISYTVYDPSNKQIEYNDISFLIGSNDVHPVFNMAAYKMQRGTTKTLLFHNNISAKKLFHDDKAEDYIFIVEISSL